MAGGSALVGFGRAWRVRLRPSPLPSPQGEGPRELNVQTSPSPLWGGTRVGVHDADEETHDQDHPPDHGAGRGEIPDAAEDRDRRRDRADLRRRVRHLRARQCRRASARRCIRCATSCRPIARRTSRAWPMPRSPLPRPASAAACMAATSSIGPGATNMVTAAALAHVNRLPVLLLPGDVFANRAPDPVLQQVERLRRRHGHGQRRVPPGVALLRPHHPARADHPGAQPRHAGADRSGRMRPGDAEPLPGRAGRGLSTIPRASSPSGSGRRAGRSRMPTSSSAAVAALKAAKKPVIIAGGGVLYSEAAGTLQAFAERTACR